MPIYLDGEPIPGYDHRLTAQGQIERKDLSGDSSSTAAGHAGWKPWLLALRCRVDYDRPDALLALRVMFQATDQTEGQTGAPRLWEIADETAEALGIFTVRFTDAMQVEPDGETRRWNVTLHLVEERSYPEMAEERAQSPVEATGAAPGGVDTSGAETAVQTANQALSSVEKVLSFLNEKAGQLFFDVKPKSES